MRELEQLRQLIITELLSEYAEDEAIDSVNKSEIKVKGNTITVTYENGAIDVYEVVKIEKIKHVGSTPACKI